MSTTAGGDTFSLYVNPGLILEPTTPLYSASGLDISFDHLGIERWTLDLYNRAMYLDEIRLGQTYEEVTPSGVIYSGSLYEDDFNRVDDNNLNYTPDTAFIWQELEPGSLGDESVKVESEQMVISSVDPDGSGTLFYVDKDLDNNEVYDIVFTG
ncbi:MAG: hypothetical protein PF795_04745, partial [Kiritimatiellae bacterium]|nr:hypothetical protein [Kiritimatiellia bacterium]